MTSFSTFITSRKRFPMLSRICCTSTGTRLSTPLVTVSISATGRQTPIARRSGLPVTPGLQWTLCRVMSSAKLRRSHIPGAESTELCLRQMARIGKHPGSAWQSSDGVPIQTSFPNGGAPRSNPTLSQEHVMNFQAQISNEGGWLRPNDSAKEQWQQAPVAPVDSDDQASTTDTQNTRRPTDPYTTEVILNPVSSDIGAWASSRNEQNRCSQDFLERKRACKKNGESKNVFYISNGILHASADNSSQERQERLEIKARKAREWSLRGCDPVSNDNSKNFVDSKYHWNHVEGAKVCETMGPCSSSVHVCPSRDFGVRTD